MLAFYFAAITFVIGVTAPMWFGSWLPHVRRIRQGAKILEASQLSPPSAFPLTVGTLRDHEKCGDKIVVAHLLADWSRELQRRIFLTLGLTSVANFLVLVAFALVIEPALHAPDATLADWAGAVAKAWPSSILLIISLLESIFIVRMVIDMADKYSGVIEAAEASAK